MHVQHVMWPRNGGVTGRTDGRGRRARILRAVRGSGSC
jgi:hypothetical protein